MIDPTPRPARMAGLLAINDRTPPILQKVPVPPRQAPVIPIRPQPLGERLREGVFSAVGGGYDGNLTLEQNQKARQNAMLMAGLQVLQANEQGISPLTAIAQGLVTGRQTGDAERQVMYHATQEERLKQALTDPETLAMLSPQQRRLVQILPPMEATKMLTEILTAPAPTPVSLGANEKLIDPTTGQEVASNMIAADPTERLPGEFLAHLTALPEGANGYFALPPEGRLQVLEQYYKEKERVARAGAPVTTISQQVQEQTATGVTEIAIGDYQKIVENAGTAQNKLGNLATMSALLDGGMTTGRMEALTEPMRGYAASIGIGDAENLSQQELFKAISNRLALQARGSGEMAGAMSDRDIQFLQRMVPRLDSTPQGNRLMIDLATRQAQREIQLQNIANQYIAEHGTLDHKWLQYKNEWIQANPLFGDLQAPF